MKYLDKSYETKCTQQTVKLTLKNYVHLFSHGNALVIVMGITSIP